MGGFSFRKLKKMLNIVINIKSKIITFKFANLLLLNISKLVAKQSISEPLSRVNQKVTTPLLNLKVNFVTNDFTTNIWYFYNNRNEVLLINENIFTY